nr:retrovirus-related Pol polyprotein from transposon TNT 1-94 [Tanacetum cinerariifolium]
MWRLIAMSFAKWLYVVLGSTGAAIFGSFNLLLAYSLQFFCTLLLWYYGDKMTERVKRMKFSAMLRDEVGWFDEEENMADTLSMDDLTLAVSTNGIGHTNDSYSFCHYSGYIVLHCFILFKQKKCAWSAVFNTFKKWKAEVENETNLQVKCLKFDNGGEYSSREFIEYYAKNGIRMLKTMPETPQQNGVAEIMNWTLNERAKRPSVPLGFRIPKEECQEKEVSLAHLRVFGCDSYVNVKDAARDKLDAKSIKCTFIGYGSNKIGYCFWDSKGHKAIRSRDVTFNEDSLYGAK